jgi:DNA-binding XRE family transcriptional regulator
MVISAREKLDSLPAARRTKIEARAKERLHEINGLRTLRQLAEQTQEQLAQTLGVKQPAIYKMEKQADMYISTLRRFIEAAGGSLELRVTMPDKSSVSLTGIGELI